MAAVAFIVILVLGIASLCTGLALTILDWSARKATSSGDGGSQPQNLESTDANVAPASPNSAAALAALLDEKVERLPPDRELKWQNDLAAAMIGLTIAILFLWAGITAWIALMLGAGAVLSLWVPLERIYEHHLRSRHRQAFAVAIDESLALARSGMTLEEAIAEVIEQCEGPARGELRRLAGARNAGVPLSTALEDARERIRLPDFDLLAAGFRLQDEAFGGTSTAFERVAGLIAKRRMLEAKRRALRRRACTWGVALIAAAASSVIAVAFVVPGFVLPFLLESSGRLTLVLAILGFGAGLFAVQAILKESLS